MTATPREPTREMSNEWLLREWAHELMTEDPERMEGVYPEIMRRLKERDALLAQAPKVWTAETIKDAPEGAYKVHRSYASKDWFEVSCKGYATHYVCKENAMYPYSGPRPGDYDLAFGPIPSPPPPEEKGG